MVQFLTVNEWKKSGMLKPTDGYPNLEISSWESLNMRILKYWMTKKNHQQYNLKKTTEITR